MLVLSCIRTKIIILRDIVVYYISFLFDCRVLAWYIQEMKKILLILIIFLLTVPAMSKTLTGGVVYTVETAREAAFDGIEYEISMEPFKKYLQDPGFISAAKKEGGRPKVSKRGRRITYFSDGEYGVVYDKNTDLGYQYNQQGQLIYIEIKSGNQYPYIKKKYKSNGVLAGVIYVVKAHESFVYKMDGKLAAHWIGNVRYDEQGNIAGKRKTLK